MRDVLVIVQFEFQQSKGLELKVSQIQFILRVCELLVVQQRRVPTVQTLQKRRDSTVQLQFLGEVVDAPVVQRPGAVVDVVVIMQRQAQQFSFAAQLRVLRFIHRQAAVRHFADSSSRS